MPGKPPVTPAVRVLRDTGIAFEPRLYRYERGAEAGAEQLGVPVHEVIKTLVMETDAGDPLVMLMHGDRDVSTRQLARTLGHRSVKMCDPDVARRHSGYQIGGTSPFGLAHSLPIYMERSISDLDRVFINGGKRGFLIEMATTDLVALLSPALVEVAVS